MSSSPSPALESPYERKAEAIGEACSSPSSTQEVHSRMNGVSISGAETSAAATSAGSTDTVGKDTRNEKVQVHGFRTINLSQKRAPQRKRKREQTGEPGNMALSSSSSSSSDEDEQLEAKRGSQFIEISNEKRDVQRHVSQVVGNTSLHQGADINGAVSSKQPNRTDAAATGREQPHEEKATRDSKPMAQEQRLHQSEGWRVKLYRLNADGSWDDCGTGSILCLYKKCGLPPASKEVESISGDAWVYQELGEPTLCMHAEVKHHTYGVKLDPKILLRTRILLRDAYQRQGENIITWCEPYLEEGNQTQGVDLALSFQDIAGCLDIWRQITEVQSKAAELFNRSEFGRSNPGGHPPQKLRNIDGTSFRAAKEANGVDELAHAAAIARGSNLQQDMWVDSGTAQHHLDNHDSVAERNHRFEDGGMATGYNEDSAGSQCVSSNVPPPPQLPNSPDLTNLEEIADTVAAVQHVQQRESLSFFIAQNECSYLKSLLSLFPSAESRGDSGSLATLAACIKTILLLNDPSIIEPIVSDELTFEEVCSAMEYDPDLREKANHRWFLRERVKFRTVALMEDEELVTSIHRSFRVKFLRDTLLRPTMDESCLSTLSSLQNFTHADVIKGVTMSPAVADNNGGLLKDSYLAKVMRVLGADMEAICEIEWKQLEELPPDGDLKGLLLAQDEEPKTDTSTVIDTGKYPQSENLYCVWRQYLAPQDGSLPSRRIRRRGCLSFLRELFDMVRLSLQPADKEDFFAVVVSMEVDLDYEEKKTAPGNCDLVEATESSETSESEFSKQEHETERDKSSQLLNTVNLLSLLGTVLCDPHADSSEKGFVLEIISVIAVHDPGLIRRRCLDTFVAWRKERARIEKHLDSIGPMRPKPNEMHQVLIHSPPNDLMSAFIFILVTETDAGLLFQVSEVLRILLDTDMLTDLGPMGSVFTDEAEAPPLGNNLNSMHEHHVNPSGSSSANSDQNQFLSMFYDHYVQWLPAPFQYKMFYPLRAIPRRVLDAQGQSKRVNSLIERFERGRPQEDPLLCPVAEDSTRSSFAVELLSFCVRAHLYRMKCYLLRSRVLGNVLKVLDKAYSRKSLPCGRCLTLAVLRFLRSVLSVKDEFYHRHIIQHNLFAPVFDAFRANPVGDNLVSSAIVEMCDFIHRENIKSLIDHIVTIHLSLESESQTPSLEDVSRPYVTTLTTLRTAYENKLNAANKAGTSDGLKEEDAGIDDSQSSYFRGGSSGRSSPTVLNEKAREDQRKFRQVDEEESYFDSDDDEGPIPSTLVPPAVDEVAAQEASKDLHPTPRRYPLMQGQMLKGTLRHLDALNCSVENSTVASEFDVSSAQKMVENAPAQSRENDN